MRLSERGERDKERTRWPGREGGRGQTNIFC